MKEKPWKVPCDCINPGNFTKTHSYSVADLQFFHVSSYLSPSYYHWIPVAQNNRKTLAMAQMAAQMHEESMLFLISKHPHDPI